MAANGFFNVSGAVFFGLSILHTFLVKYFQGLAHRYPKGSAGENFFELLGEVEVVFGFWAGLFLLTLAAASGKAGAVEYLESRNFTEPAFVFVIMTVCSTRPILSLVGRTIEGFSRLLPMPRPLAFYVSALTIGPMMGSFITEPAAMTVTALILFEKFYNGRVSESFKYATLGLLFVNVSIGGTLTPFAAPPVLMVAEKWGWDLSHMLSQFGWKGALSVILSTSLIAFKFRKEIGALEWETGKSGETALPAWVMASHLLMLGLMVATAHTMVLFFGLFLFFLGLVTVTREYQRELKLREGLLVAFFLGGLVVLGGAQAWWLEPLLSGLTTLSMYVGAIGLTAVTDNAALTYLGSQVPGLSEATRYALVAGSVVGGGLTVIANAPNPAGFGILNPAFGPDGISPFRLFVNALIPTLMAGSVFWLFKG
jgi:hypothetical protein